MNVLHVGMLLGLAAMLLPLLIHLFARRRPPVIDWGAMQFLPSRQRHRRRVMIDDIALLLLRALLLGLLAVALARPWVRGNWFGFVNAAPPCDLAVILDGSYSTAVQVDGKSVQDRMRADIRRLLEGLPTGSTVQLYDARDAVVPLLPQRSTAMKAALDALFDLPVPTGTSHLPHAMNVANRDLLDGIHNDREIIVLSDGQARPWHVGDDAEWHAVDHQLQQAAVTPRITVLVPDEVIHDVDDVGWRDAKISRERLMPGQSLTVHGTLRNASSQPQQRRVWCAVNGRPLADQQQDIRLPANGVTDVKFELRFPAPGQHAVSLRSDADVLPGNDHAEFIAEVVTGVKVLLVDGSPSPDPVRSEVFFARAALEQSADVAGWIELSTISIADLNPDNLTGFAVVILANVSLVELEQLGPLSAFFARGGSLLIALGDRVAQTASESFPAKNAWLPIELGEWHESAAATETTAVSADSLAVPWLQRFRPDRGAELCEAEFRGWWSTLVVARNEREAPQVLARFTNGDPWLISARRGKGTVMVATSPLDADANTLPAKPDYVAWLHELLLAVSAPAQPRNLTVGEAIPIRPAQRQMDDTTGIDPWGSMNRFERNREATWLVRWPGVFVLTKSDAKLDGNGDPQFLCGKPDAEAFAARTDGSEGDFTALTAADRDWLATGRPLRFVDTVENWQERRAQDAPRSELAWWLLWGVLILLMGESLLTGWRRPENR